jgi:uncharacterized heparinase superfamily protein
MNLSQARRLLRTVRHLRSSQVAWRIRYLLERRTGLFASSLPEPPAGLAPSPAFLRGEFPRVPLLEHPGPTGPEAVAMLEAGELVHLNHRLKIGRAKPYWRLGNQQQERLWTVTLHYHRWAYELVKAIKGDDEHSRRAEALFKEYIASWIEDCDLAEPGARDLAWNCYAIATRLGWWVRACLELGPARLQAWTDFTPRLYRSMWRQAAYLNAHPERDLLANHILRDALGLAWAGRFFPGDAPRQWLQNATAIALEQIDEQVLPDGGHLELSPMYHLVAMEDVMKIAALIDDPAAVAKLRAAWAAMARYLVWMRHPDGHVPLFNDSALNSSAEPAQMLALAPELGVELDPGLPRGGRHFPDSGMVVWHGDPWSLFFDVGPIGPDYQPGHSHADTLTIEASFRGRRLIVDPGSHSYDNNATRRYDRSTAAHNTVCIDEQDSSEVWQIFRVGRRAYPVGAGALFGPDWFQAAAAHTGYDHLPGRPRHHRSIGLSQGRLTITDRIEGQGRHQLEGGLLLAPEVAVRGDELTLNGGRLRVTVTGPPGLAVGPEPRPYHPEYGLELTTTRLVWRVNADLPVTVATVLEPL